MDHIKFIKKEKLEEFLQEFQRVQILMGKSQVYGRLLENGIDKSQLEDWFQDVEEALRVEDVRVIYDPHIPGLKEQIDVLTQFYQRKGRQECIQYLYDLGMDMKEMLALLSLSKLDVLLIADLSEVLQENEKHEGLMN